MSTTTTITWAAALARSRSGRSGPVPHRGRPRRLHGDRGEGVISAAIAVLIMAFLGAAMWVGFQTMWKTTSQTTNDKVEQIGNG
jgi:hypothetical protein